MAPIYPQQASAPNLVLRGIVVVNLVLLLLVALPPFNLAAQEALRRAHLETAFQVWLLGSTLALPGILIGESLRRFRQTRRARRENRPPPPLYHVWIDLLVVAVWLVALTIVVLQRAPLVG